MNCKTPHVVLVAESSSDGDAGNWQFQLNTTGGEPQLEANDQEEGITGERLELFCVLRGLEALEQPTRVTLVTKSRYVNRMLAYGLDDWRENDWCWEHYGRWVPIKHRDLWQRVDGALKYHSVKCRTWRVDSAHSPSPPSHSPASASPRPKLLNRAKELVTSGAERIRASSALSGPLAAAG